MDTHRHSTGSFALGTSSLTHAQRSEITDQLCPFDGHSDWLVHLGPPPHGNWPKIGRRTDYDGLVIRGQRSQLNQRKRSLSIFPTLYGIIEDGMVYVLLDEDGAIDLVIHDASSIADIGLSPEKVTSDTSTDEDRMASTQLIDTILISITSASCTLERATSDQVLA